MPIITEDPGGIIPDGRAPSARGERRLLGAAGVVLLLLALLFMVPVFQKVELQLGLRRLEAHSFNLVWDDRVHPAWQPGLHVMPDEFMAHPESTTAIYLRVGDWVYFTFWAPAQPKTPAGR